MNIKKIMLALFIIFSVNTYADVDIIANYESDISLSSNEIRQMFTGGHDRWPDGTRVVIVLLKKENRIQREFIRRTLGLSVSYYYRLYRKDKNNIFYKELISEKNMIEILLETPGGVGVIENYAYYYNGDSLKRVTIK